MSKLWVIIRKLACLSRTDKKAKVLIAVMLAVILIFVSVLFIELNAYTEDLNKGLSDNLIRLHVIANSDAPEDQELKRNVRDAVLDYVRNELEDSKDIEKTKAIISSKIKDITAVAKRTVSSSGSNYPVSAVLGNYPFPTKAYGDIKLPAGSYQALRIIIGKGEGANWWCVLFPPLCFVDVTHGTVPDSVKTDLKEVLTEEEYSIVTSADEESDIPIKIKFKLVELLQDSKIKLAGALSRLLNSPG